MTPRERANAMLAQGAWAEAAHCYAEALSHEPRDSRNHVGRGFALMQLGKQEEARSAFESALAMRPDAADAHHLLGVILRSQGDLDGCLRHFEEAVRLDPAQEQVHRDLVSTLVAQGRPEAASAASRSVAAAPGAADLHFYLGVALERQGDFGGAARAYERSIALEPTYAAHMNLAGLYVRSQRFQDALGQYERAVAMRPDDPEVHLGMGNLFRQTGQRNAAIECYRRSLTLRPHVGTAHILAALEGKAGERASDAYVEMVFDQYADTFDEHLVQQLQYNSPEQIVATLRTIWPPPRKQYAVLDLGCGTGLMGVQVSPYAGSLVGVDLSQKMLDKAQSRNLYTRLVRADLAQMMSAEPDASYDAILAADVFVYIGNIDDIAAHAHRLLRAGGIFAFTVEAAKDTPGSPPYLLAETGRYTHARSYIDALASRHGFEGAHVRSTVGRVNMGMPVESYLAWYRRP